MAKILEIICDKFVIGVTALGIAGLSAIVQAVNQPSLDLKEAGETAIYQIENPDGEIPKEILNISYMNPNLTNVEKCQKGLYLNYTVGNQVENNYSAFYSTNPKFQSEILGKETTYKGGSSFHGPIM